MNPFCMKSLVLTWGTKIASRSFSIFMASFQGYPFSKNGGWPQYLESRRWPLVSSAMEDNLSFLENERQWLRNLNSNLFMSSYICCRLQFEVFFHPRSSSIWGCPVIMVIFHLSSSSSWDCLAFEIVFHLRSSSICCCLHFDCAYHLTLSSIWVCLPFEVVFHLRLSLIWGCLLFWDHLYMKPCILVIFKGGCLHEDFVNFHMFIKIENSNLYFISSFSIGGHLHI